MGIPAMGMPVMAAPMPMSYAPPRAPPTTATMSAVAPPVYGGMPMAAPMPATTMVMGPDMNRDGIPDFMQGGAYGGFGGVPTTTMAAPAMGYPTTTMSYAAPTT